ncbi:hypothetical protein [Nostoc sp.]|uniref:hypothetical protein n=1 Tax=Nostoc sp. TaxID=1180 RepID=UPI002FF9218D
MQNTVFTELTVSEEASLSGGNEPPKAPSNSNKVKIGKKAKVGVGGGAVSGGTIGGNSGDATGGDGVYIAD